MSFSITSSFAGRIYNGTLSQKKQPRDDKNKGGIMTKTTAASRKGNTPFDFVLAETLKVRALREKIKEKNNSNKEKGTEV